tara:strand:+ start:526 stop:696 length:171 start_codon:yes stop_codon:yes gene_type:complete
MNNIKELRKELQQTINDIKSTIQLEGENFRCKYSGQTASEQLRYYTNKYLMTFGEE